LDLGCSASFFAQEIFTWKNMKRQIGLYTGRAFVLISTKLRPRIFCLHPRFNKLRRKKRRLNFGPKPAGSFCPPFDLNGDGCCAERTGGHCAQRSQRFQISNRGLYPQGDIPKMDSTTDFRFVRRPHCRAANFRNNPRGPDIRVDRANQTKPYSGKNHGGIGTGLHLAPGLVVRGWMERIRPRGKPSR